VDSVPEGEEGPRVGFIGYGAVASTFARAMATRGARVYAYDVLLEEERGRERLARRAGEVDVQFLLVDEMLASVGYVLSTNAADVALGVAEQCAPLLCGGQVYLDLNSTSPQVKRRIGRAVAPSGASFVEGAILDAVGAAGAGAQILLGGPHAAGVAGTLCDLGLNAAAFSDQIGLASTLKMLRSVFSKGVEALLIECLVAARRAGLQDALWEALTETMRGASFETQADNWVRTHASAYERRYHEMIQVEETVRDLGLEPVMTAATRALFARSCDLGLDDAFPDGAERWDAVIAFLERQLGRTDANE
jgi:3-hydroxyisobutyrate dehydrogenase-like beta-hydroxyacid dehydrogenase